MTRRPPPPSYRTSSGPRVAALDLPGPDPAQGWRHALTPDQIAEIDRVAGEELRRIGYGG